MPAMPHPHRSDSVSAIVSAVVRAGMSQRGERQHDLARVLGIARSAVAQRLTGVDPWRLRDLDVLARHYGLTVPQMVDAATVDRLAVHGSDPCPCRLHGRHGQDSGQQYGPSIGQLALDSAERDSDSQQRQPHAVQVDPDRLVS